MNAITLWVLVSISQLTPVSDIESEFIRMPFHVEDPQQSCITAKITMDHEHQSDYRYQSTCEAIKFFPSNDK